MEAAARIEASDDLLLRIFSHTNLTLTERVRLGASTSKRWLRLLQLHLRLTQHDAWRGPSLISKNGHINRLDISSLQLLSEAAWDGFVCQLLRSLSRDGAGRGLRELLMWDPTDASSCGVAERSLTAQQLGTLLSSCPNLGPGTRLALRFPKASAAASAIATAPAGRHCVHIHLEEAEVPPVENAGDLLDGELYPAGAAARVALIAALRCPHVVALLLTFMLEPNPAAAAGAEVDGRVIDQVRYIFSELAAELADFLCSSGGCAALQHIRIGSDLGDEFGPTRVMFSSAEDLDAALLHLHEERSCATDSAAATAPQQRPWPPRLRSVGFTGGYMFEDLMRRCLLLGYGTITRLELGSQGAFESVSVSGAAQLRAVFERLSGTLEWLSIGGAECLFEFSALSPLLTPQAKLGTLELHRSAIADSDLIAGLDSADEDYEAFERDFCGGLQQAAALRRLLLDVGLMDESRAGKTIGEAIAARAAPLAELVLRVQCFLPPDEMMHEADPRPGAPAPVLPEFSIS